MIEFAKILKANPYHDEKGRFTSKDKTGGPGMDIGAWRDKGLVKAKQDFAALSVKQKDAYADPKNTIPARVRELVGETPDFSKTKIGKIADARMEQLKGLITSDAVELGKEMLNGIASDLKAAVGDTPEARKLMGELTDHLVAQELEASERSLGDHGIHHLNGDRKIAVDTLAAVPGANTPENRAMMGLAAVLHDTGYMTPPSRSWADEEHPAYSDQYFNKVMRGKIEGLFGDTFASKLSKVISTHDSPVLDWEGDPTSSAFRLADNLALFHKEKMPPFLRTVPTNLKTLVELGEGKVDLDTAKATMRKNINDSGVPPHLKAAYLHAVDEVSPVLPKFTLGMIGAGLGNIKWKDDHVSVDLIRRSSNRALSKVMDLGQKQFGKFAATYGVDKDALLTKGNVKLEQNGKVYLEANLLDQKVDSVSLTDDEEKFLLRSEAKEPVSEDELRKLREMV